MQVENCRKSRQTPPRQHMKGRVATPLEHPHEEPTLIPSTTMDSRSAFT